MRVRARHGQERRTPERAGAGTLAGSHLLAVCLPLVLLASFASIAAIADETAPATRSLEEHVVELVQAVRAETGVVALAAGIVTREGLQVEVARGERRRGSGQAVEVGDRWHIASCSKAMTALLYGRLVEEGRADWGARLSELFPHLAEEMHPHWKTIRVEDLLSHRAGLGDVGAIWWIGGRLSRLEPAAQRRRTVERLLRRPPTHPAGTFHYSNFGYMMLGAAIEGLVARAEGRDLAEPGDWEVLLTQEVWARLDAPGGLGFGPPQGEEPEGHAPRWPLGLRPVGQGRAADNPRAFGPAGIVHADFASWASFAKAMLPGPSPFSDALRARVTTPYPDAKSEYGLGWFVRRHPTLGPIWNHPGSNRMWRAVQTIVPEQGFAILVATNQADAAGILAVDQLTERLLERVPSAL